MKNKVPELRQVPHLLSSWDSATTLKSAWLFQSAIAELDSCLVSRFVAVDETLKAAFLESPHFARYLCNVPLLS